MEMPPQHVVTAEQFTAAEERREQERVAAKCKLRVSKDEEALRVSMEQMREVRHRVRFTPKFKKYVLPTLSSSPYCVILYFW